MTLMGVGTFFIGLLPSYASIGIIAPIILIGLRLAQDLALGSEYGGAAIYVCEHAPRPCLQLKPRTARAGLFYGWIARSAACDRVVTLLALLRSRVSSVVEQRFCKPLVGGSNPSPGTSKIEL
jgi:MFS family permease